MALSKCQRPGPLSCTCNNIRTHYQHIAPGINHQWDIQPSEGPGPDSVPHPAPCPNDVVQTGPWPAVYSRCPLCGYIKTWPQS